MTSTSAAPAGAPATPSAPRTARARARATLTQEIVDTARTHLATAGAAGLSLRAVARDLGMASSAVYRYFPSRDDLLTRLIIDAYDGVGDAASAADAELARADLVGRWMAIAHATRDWALAHPQEWGLIYGTPVPDYVAPDDTIVPGTRVSVALVAVLADAVAQGRAPTPTSVPEPVLRGMRSLRELVPDAVPDSFLIAGVMARTQLFGHISLELDGQFANTITHLDAFFNHIMHVSAESLGLG